MPITGVASPKFGGRRARDRRAFRGWASGGRAGVSARGGGFSALRLGGAAILLPAETFRSHRPRAGTPEARGGFLGAAVLIRRPSDERCITSILWSCIDLLIAEGNR